MIRLEKEDSRQRFKEIRELWCEWDPIWVTSLNDWPQAEYDNYLGPTLRLLEEGASNQKIAAYLSYVVGEYMGLGESGIKHSKPLVFAEKLRNWYESKWPNTHV